MKKEYTLQSLGCANCAAKMEEQIQRLTGIESAHVNFVAKKLSIHSEDPQLLEPEIVRIVQSIEPDVQLIPIDQQLDPVEEEPETGEIKRLVIGLGLFIAALLVPDASIVRLPLFIAAYLIAGYNVLRDAFRGILRGDVFNENFLMGIATIGAFVIGEYPEGVAVMLFYLVGEIFQDRAVDNSRKSIRTLLDIRPDTASVLREGKVSEVHPSEITIGETIYVRPGERIPLDGEVKEGEAYLDTSALTGESLPRFVQTGDAVLSGSICTNRPLTISVTKAFSESTVSKILELVENAGARKAPTEQFITKFARYYTPAVVIAAVLLAVLPPLFITGASFQDWLYRALVFLVVSCPCALVVSIPLGFFGGIGAASKQGILIKGGNYLEALNQARTVVFDKTGTLTKGEFVVTSILPKGISEAELLQIAAMAESHSNHPIAESIRVVAGSLPVFEQSKTEEIAGKGIATTIDGQRVLAGNAALLQGEGIVFDPIDTIGTVVFLSVDGEYRGAITIADEIKADAKEAIDALHAIGVRQTVLLTGDRVRTAQDLRQQLGIDTVHAELLPQDKVRIVEDLHQSMDPKSKLVFVGDGINDAPVIARADIGIAMGALGSDAAIEAADIVLMTDEPSKVATAMRIAAKTRRIVLQNIVFALGIKALVLLLSAIGYASMWAAVFADVGVAVLAVLNSMRMLRS